MLINEILVRWTTPGSPGGTSVLYFDATITPIFARNSLNAALLASKAVFNNQTSWVIGTSGNRYEDTTGDLDGFWTDNVVQGGTGTANTKAVSNSTMALLRSKTDTIVANRRLQGRTYMPGVDTQYISNGEFNGSGQAALLTGFTSGFAASAGAVVWHRPKSGSLGVAAPVVSYSAWNEFAVLRNRRR